MKIELTDTEILWVRLALITLSEIQTNIENKAYPLKIEEKIKKASEE